MEWMHNEFHDWIGVAGKKRLLLEQPTCGKFKAELKWNGGSQQIKTNIKIKQTKLRLIRQFISSNQFPLHSAIDLFSWNEFIAEFISRLV